MIEKMDNEREEGVIAEAVAVIRAALEGRIVGIALFGSRVGDGARPGSDLDLAVLPREPLGTMEVWDLAQDVANRVHVEIDLVDLWRASTVLCHEIVTKGRWAHREDPSACALFEAQTLTRYGHLNEERGAILAAYEGDGEAVRG